MLMIGLLLLATNQLLFPAGDALKVKQEAISLVVASHNKVKIGAVENAIKQMMPSYQPFIKSVEVESGVEAQPLSLNATITGAINRAKNAFKDCDLSFGIESGLMEVSQTKTGFLNVCVCALFDGKDVYLGLSPAFECPENVIRLITQEKLELSDAFKKAGITNENKLGTGQGAIGILSQGKMDRLELTQLAVNMAIIAYNSEKKLH
jgi:inosine/xanthosine triphosphatase